MKKIDLLIIIFILFLSLITLKDLYKPGFYTSHDGPHQIVRLYYFDQALKDGQIPPRWAGGLLNGFGYPLFIFSYQLPWLIAEPIHLLGFSITDSIKLTFLLGFFLSGVSMYFFQREIFSKLAAFTATILYLFAPYRFANIFVRAAIGDATSFIFLPLIFLSLYNLKAYKKKFWLWTTIGAFSFAAVLLSHAMIFFLLSLSLILYLLYWSIFIRKLYFFKEAVLMSILGLCLSAYYFIPSLVERNYTNFSAIFKSAYFGNTFVSLNKLIYSPWGYGTIDAYEGAMSVQIGIAQWLTVILFIIFILFLILFKRKSLESQTFKYSLFFLILFVSSVLIMLKISLPFWNLLKNIAYLDFTWRVLPITILCVSVLGGFIVNKFKYPILLSMILIIFALYSNRNHLRINQSLDWSMPFYLKLEKTTNSFDEYTPKWLHKNLVEQPKSKIELPGRQGEVHIERMKSNDIKLYVSVPKADTLRLNTVYYPGWTAYIMGKEKNIDYQKSGLIDLPITKGKSVIEFKFRETPLRIFSDFVTLITMIFLSFMSLKYYKKL